jgi:hypothetical protein
MIVFAIVPPAETFVSMIIFFEIVIPFWVYVPGLRMIVSPGIASVIFCWIESPGLRVCTAADVGATITARPIINNPAKTTPFPFRPTYDNFSPLIKTKITGRI